MATRTVDLGSVVGPQGPAGPNEITTATETNLTGVLMGDGSNVDVKPVDAAPTPGSTNLVESGGVYGLVSNRNLLDNWYFVNPVNQRGNTSYSGAVYGIDRWKGANAYGNIAVQSDGLQINNIANAFFAIDQLIENGATNLNGKTVTLSVLTSSGELVKGTGTLNLTGTSQAFIQFYFSDNKGIAQVNASTSNVSVRLRVQNNQTIKVAAVKLELGSVSTLANDAAPCFAEELAKCQRYFYRFNGLVSAYTVPGSSVSAVTIPFPVTMIGVPAISNITHFDSKVSSGQGTYVSGARFYNSSNVGFSVTGFDVSADL